MDGSMSFGRAKAWGLVTSTPQRETKRDIYNLDVQLSDGSGSRSLEINSGMTLLDLLNTVMDRLGGRGVIEGLSYESTSWSRKIGANKYVPHFLDSQMEVDKFFNRIREHREEQKRLKKKVVDPDITLIVTTQAQVVVISFFYYSDLLTGHSQASGKSTTQKRSETRHVQDALQSARSEYDNQIEKISREITMNFKCDKHGGILCGRIKNSNDHIPYTNTDLLEHAKMIVSRLAMLLIVLVLPTVTLSTKGYLELPYMKYQSPSRFWTGTGRKPSNRLPLPCQKTVLRHLLSLLHNLRQPCILQPPPKSFHTVIHLLDHMRQGISHCRRTGCDPFLTI